MNPIVYLITLLLNLYSWVLIIWIVLSWLISFNVVNRYNPFVARVNDVLFRLTNPVLRPIRRVLPPVGGVDFSPIVLFIGIEVIRYSLFYYF